MAAELKSVTDNVARTSQRLASPFPEITRRRFITLLGFGGMAGLLGGLLGRMSVPTEVPQTSDIVSGESCPRVRHDVVIDGEKGGRVGVRCFRGGREDQFAVNAAGYEIIRLLDGAHNIDHLAVQVASLSGASVTEELRAKVANFVANLGALGCLEDPFIVQIIERRGG